MRPRAELDVPVLLDRARATPLHLQLAAALRSAVHDGLLTPGERLPPTRLLATQLAVARATVLAAYEQLAGEGYLETRHGSGTYLAGHVPTAPTPAPPTSRAPAIPTGRAPASGGALDLRPGQPDTSRLPDPTWRAAWRQAGSGPLPPVEPPTQGLPALREQVAAHLRAARGVPADPADVLITAGTSDALALIVHALTAASDLVAVEDPGYPASWRVITRLGRRLHPVPVDDHGLRVDHLTAPPHAPAGPPRLALVTPSHQYPLGGCLPIGRRLALLAWAVDHDALVVEDDYDSEFRFAAAPLPALASLDPGGRVLHLGSFSKVLSPWLRAGYLLAPPPLRQALLGAREDLGTPVSGLDQQALATYLAAGALPRHIARMRRDYAHRRQHLIDLLATHPHLRLRGARAGLHAVIDLPTGTDVPALLAACTRAGYLLADLQDYTTGPSVRPAVILGYAGATLGDLQGAVTTLADLTR